MVTGPGPYYAPLAELDRDQARQDFEDHQWLAMALAQHAVGRVRPGGTPLFRGSTSSRSRGPGLSMIAAATAAMPALIANLAVEVAPIRVNLIAACRVRRHPAVGHAARRRPGGAPRAAPRHAAH